MMMLELTLLQRIQVFLHSFSEIRPVGGNPHENQNVREGVGEALMLPR